MEKIESISNYPALISSENSGKILPECDSRLSRTPMINIDFEDLTYTVRVTSGHSNKKLVLNKVNGCFRAGELIALMGPSGAGKSSLMNILAGYVSAGVTGIIQTNGCRRDLKQFNKLSTYIMQEDLLQPHLTVHEAMCIAADLKLGDQYTLSEKLATVDDVLATLGLSKCRDTRGEMLSGGQRKRLSVALELVNNPPVIFLDEPTTGLDSVAIKQSVTLLKSLAQQGRTIVCTIHQPTSSIFQLFDQAYFLANGKCVYHGATNMLVPYLSSVGLSCPTTHNPADYIIEIIHGNPETIQALSSEMNDGRVKKWEKSATISNNYYKRQDENVYNNTTMNTDYNFPTTFWSQFNILLRRKMLQTRRNFTMLYIQFAHHFISGMLLGGIFLGLGNDGKYAVANFKYGLSCLVFFMYTYVMIPVLVFPNEFKIARREYFNRWYGLKAFYWAHTLSTIPPMIVFGIIFMIVSYLLSSQPIESSRFAWFAFFGILTGMCSEGLGLAVAANFSSTNGSIVGPATAVPFLALSVYGIGAGDLSIEEPFMTFLMSLSYLRYGLVGMTESIFGYNRTSLGCSDDLYCHYKHPKMLLKDLGMESATYTNQVIGLTVCLILFRVIAYLSLRYRLTAEFSNRILNYAAKVLRHK